jgi:hypothetical protein
MQGRKDSGAWTLAVAPGRCSQRPRALAHIVTVSACTSWQQGLGCTALRYHLHPHPHPHQRSYPDSSSLPLFPSFSLPLRRDLRPFPQTHPRPCPCPSPQRREGRGARASRLDCRHTSQHHSTRPHTFTRHIVIDVEALREQTRGHGRRWRHADPTPSTTSPKKHGRRARERGGAPASPSPSALAPPLAPHAPASPAEMKRGKGRSARRGDPDRDSPEEKKERCAPPQPALMPTPENTSHSKKKKSLIPKNLPSLSALRRALPSATAVEERRKSLQESSQRQS